MAERCVCQHLARPEANLEMRLVVIIPVRNIYLEDEPFIYSDWMLVGAGLGLRLIE